MDNKKLRIAYHETGHAIMALLCRQGIKRVSLKEMDSPRGTEKYRGYMKLESDERKIKLTGEEAVQKIRISLAGYASETLFFGGAGIGGDDLKVAVDLVEDMLRIDGFRNWVAELPVPNSLNMIENPLIRAYIDYRIDQCTGELAPFRRVIQVIAEELFEKEELTGDEVSAHFNSFMRGHFQQIASRGSGD